MDPKEIFKSYCKANRYRNTPERLLIIDEIYRKDGHFDTDALFLRIRKRYPKYKIAKTSIYRTLPHLIRAGLIGESFHKDGKSYYEHLIGHSHHDHIKCLKCGTIIEFHDDQIDKMQQKLCQKYKFEMTQHIHILEGYCRKCQKRTKPRENA